VHLKSGLIIRGVAFGGSGLIRGLAFLEGDNLVVFYYLSASEIWPDYKRCGLWWEWTYKKGTTEYPKQTPSI
jgi:hypothetical protein